MDGDNDEASVIAKCSWNGNWENEYKHLPSDKDQMDYFGQSIGMYRNKIVVDSNNYENGASGKSVHSFALT